MASVSMTCKARQVLCTQNDSSHGPSPRLCTPHVKPLVPSARLEVTVCCHFGHHFLFFSRHPDLLPGTVGLARRVDTVLFCGSVGCFRFNVLAFRGRLQLQALHGKLLNAIGQAPGTILNLGPEVVTPESILAHGVFQRLEPEIKRRKSSLAMGDVVALQVV